MLRLCTMAALASVCVCPAFAQSWYIPEYQQWEASGFGGGSFIGHFQLPTMVLGRPAPASQTVGMRYGTGYAVGLRASEYLGNYWAADLEYTFSNQPLTFTNLSPEIQSLELGQSVHHLTYGASLFLLPRTSRFRPYAKIGAGASLFYIHKDAKHEAAERGVPLRDSWKFLMDWGGGIRYLAADGVSLTFEAKDHVSGIPSYGLPREARVVNGVFMPGMARRGTMHNWQFVFGIGYQWDD